MADPRQQTDQNVASRRAAGDPSIERAVVDMHIARRTLLIYPASHEQVKRTLVKAYRSLAAILRKQRVFSLTVMDGGLGTDAGPLNAKNSVFKELALDFKRYGIAMVRFEHGMAARELARFLQLLTIDSDTIAAKGGIASAAAKAGLDHLTVRAVDYSQLELTEEQEIRRNSESEQDGSVWHQFVARMLERQSDGQQEPSGPVVVDPGKLARLLNDRRLDIRTAVDRYGDLLADAYGDTGGSQLLSEALMQFQRLIKDLTPELQDQFLTATFNRCGESATVSETASLIDGLGVDLIVRMLRHASADGREISPSLLAFINKMGQADAPGSRPEDNRGPAELSSENLDALMSREEYESYVDEGYAKLLHTLAVHAKQDTEKSRDFTQIVEQGISGASILSHIGKAIERLMAGSKDTAGYRNWARQLTYLLDDLLDSGAFGYLAELIAAVRAEQGGGDPERAAIADLVMDRFNDPQFVAAAIDMVRHTMQEMSPDALMFLMELGEPVVVEIFDGLDPELTFHDQGALSQVLENLSSLTAKEALARVNDSRPEYVRRMIRIIRRMGDTPSAEHIRPLLHHNDFDVRAEALATLLNFRNKWGLMRLRELMDMPWSSEVMRAFNLAGRYRVREVVPRLIELAQGRGGIERREAALRALGQIGDSAAVPVLARLVRRRWNVFSKKSRYLKQIVFETLDGYAPEAVKDLIHLGLQQSDERIRVICENTLREMSRKSRGRRSAGK